VLKILSRQAIGENGVMTDTTQIEMISWLCKSPQRLHYLLELMLVSKTLPDLELCIPIAASF